MTESSEDGAVVNVQHLAAHMVGMTETPTPPTHNERFVTWTHARIRADAAFAAAARRAYGRRFDDPAVAPLVRTVNGFTKDGRPLTINDKIAFYAVLSYLAKWGNGPTGTNLGRAIWNARAITAEDSDSPPRKRVPENDALARRIVSLSRSPLEQVAYSHIPRILPLLAQEHSLPCMASLLRDLRRWPYASDRVSHAWLNSVYA